LTDLYAFAATVVAGGVVWITGFQRADPIASLAVAASMLWAAWPLLRRSGRVLLEAAPEGLDAAEIAAAMRGAHGVTNVHDLHVWTIGTGFPALSAHVLVARDEDCHAIRRDLERLLHDRFGLEHTTLQVEHTAERLLDIVRRSS
ncbi:MAG TPA: cation diffusion facilitator family transporter, partial [Gaiellaceae bacterium]